MTLTRDQLRAARTLLHLTQDALADLAGVAVATIRRFETGNDIRPAQTALLRRALEGAGAILVEGEAPVGMRLGVGVVLFPEDELPRSTRDRIEAEAAREGARIEADRLRRDAHRAEPRKNRPRGRPRKNADESPTDSTVDDVSGRRSDGDGASGT